MIVDKAVYRDGVRHDCGDLAETLELLRESRDGFLWVGLKDPTDAEFDEARKALDLHPLAVEDALNGKQRVKVERYGETTFAVLKTLRYVEATSDVETGEIMIFVGDHFAVSVRWGEAAPLAGVRRRLQEKPQLMRETGSLAVFHAVLDSIVDTYRDIDGEIQQDLEEMERAVLAEHDTGHSAAVYLLKREVLEFRRAADPLVKPVSWLRDPEGPISSEELRLQFRDVEDHLRQVVEHIDSYDRLLTDVLSVHLSQVGVQQNDDMRKISAWVAIAAVPTLLAGIFGMNFQYMPGLGWGWGYPAALLLMLIICLALYRAFRRSGWL
ncbi:MAG TPA: magnesium and cobalt transport protein CorA [Ornithinimicrobium sp.]|uniref:magnesium and cobalt transport protein CorA n=1 Tax=Ornithinimicrobium sp. TaxID=1977084 RepID=UPI002B459C96|nr:magnesium and cobalt transport protein CorA [Ornithinimicrobium sp.]HKJ12292.1 magnesium and cobalt transport protein CorA [Ornithinimicrobium sp.]